MEGSQGLLVALKYKGRLRYFVENDFWFSMGRKFFIIIAANDEWNH